MINGIGALNATRFGDLFTDGPGAAASGAASPAGGVGSSFAAMLGEAATRTVGTLHQAEQISVKALQGEAETRDVVNAVMSAEQSLQAAIAIRDKIVTAYLEVSRMAI